MSVFSLNDNKNCADPLRAEDIRRSITCASPVSVSVFDSVGSTNDIIKQLASDGAPEGCVAVADRQTGGRGRMGRSFFSPPDSGIYMSLLLRPDLPAELSVLMTTAAAVAVCEGIERACGVETGIKWVNDIFLGGRKVCGILTEAAFSPDGERISQATVGIGINVYPPRDGFPETSGYDAGYVTDVRRPGLRSQIAAGVISSFFGYYASIGERTFVPEYRRRSVVIGRDIFVISNGGGARARALEIDDDCRLRVRYEDGSQELLRAGEISIRPAGCDTFCD